MLNSSELRGYVSDGYINSRVAKMNKEGEWLKTWGERGAGPTGATPTR